MAKFIASVSFGADSTAMLLRLLEEQQKVDEVIFVNLGAEFKAVYDTRDKILSVLKEQKIKYTELKPETDYWLKMFADPRKKRNGSTVYGYGWCGVCRWGTGIKIDIINKYIRSTYQHEEVIEYVGIAADEKARLAKERKANKIYPLADWWNMSQKDSLDYCLKLGYDWAEVGRVYENGEFREAILPLYSILDRCSCFCCQMKNMKELYNIYLHLPQYWELLKGLQLRIPEPFKSWKGGRRYTVFDLEKRFEKKFNDECRQYCFWDLS